MNKIKKKKIGNKQTVEKLRAIFLTDERSYYHHKCYLIGPSIMLQVSYEIYFIGYTCVDSHPHTLPHSDRRRVEKKVSPPAHTECTGEPM